MPLYLQDIGATPTDIGLVFGVGNVIAAMTFLPIGFSADRWGGKRFMVGTLLGLAGAGLGALAPGRFLSVLVF